MRPAGFSRREHVFSERPSLKQRRLQRAQKQRRRLRGGFARGWTFDNGVVLFCLLNFIALAIVLRDEQVCERMLGPYSVALQLFYLMYFCVTYFQDDEPEDRVIY